MKVGILTLKLHSNFGFLMQSYALQKVVRDLGHEPFHFYIKVESCSFSKKVELLIKRTIRNCFWGTNFQLFPHYPTKADMEFMDNNTWNFIHKHLSLTPYIPSLVTKYAYNLTQYDAYIVGSDQVWRREFTDDIRCYYFNFVSEGRKRMSYAASFGSDTLSYSRKRLKECGNLLKKFNIITVREDDGIRICNDYFGCNAIKVLDPTLLLSAADYCKLIQDNEPLLCNEPYIFLYMLRPTKDKMSFVQQFAKEKNMNVINIMPQRFEVVGRKRINECVFPTISSWLSGFKNASYIITDSFHASVFSIIFHKKFYVFNDLVGGVTRIPSLLNTLKIKNNISNNDSYCQPKLDYDKIEGVLEQLKQQSISIIQNFLDAE